MRTALRSPEVFERFISALRATQRSVELQLQAREAEFEVTRSVLQNKGELDKFAAAAENYWSKRAGSTRYMSRVEEALHNARRLHQPFEAELIQRLHDRDIEIIRLVTAIRNHHDARPPEDASEADVALWQVIPVDLPDSAGNER